MSPSHSFCFVLTAAATLFPFAARASDTTPCGSGFGKVLSEELNLLARESDFPPGSAARDALLDVVSAWSGTRSQIEFSVSFTADPDHEPQLENWSSEVYFVDNANAQASTEVWIQLNNCAILEADVVLLDSYDWSTSTDPSDLTPYAGGSAYPLRTVLFHELGHAQGLGHTSDKYSVMGEDFTHLHLNDGLVTAYPGEDAVTKSVALYGNVAGAYEDLGLTHWKRTGFQGPYSLHGRTSVSGSPGSTVLKIDEADVLFEVGVGEKVRVEITVENFGKSAQDARIGYYISANDNLSTGDRFLGSEIRHVVPDAPTTIVSPELTIPADLEGETNYWIGAIIDDNMLIAEVGEWNNRTSIRVVTRELPKNLVASAISGPGSRKAGTAASITSTVMNLGGGDVNAFTYEIRLSTNTTITTSDTLVASVNDTSLGFNFDQVMIPGNLVPGTYYWGLRVVPIAGESSTSDNVLAGNAVTITKGDPDMVALAVSGPASIEVGDSVTIQFNIANEGGSVLGPYYYKLYLSQDNDIEPTDIEVKSGLTFTLGAKSVNATIPALPATGFYRLGMIVTGMAGETDLADNAVLGNTVNVTSIFGPPGGVTSN